MSPNVSRLHEPRAELIAGARGHPRWETLPAAFDAWVRRYATQEALVFGDERLSFKALGEKVDQAAARFMAAGIGAGDKVALWMPNGIAWVCAFFALARAGAVIVPVNTRYKNAEVENILRHGDVTAIVLDATSGKVDFAGKLLELLPDLRAEGGGVRTAVLPALRHLISVSESAHNQFTVLASVLPATPAALAGRQRLISPDAPVLMIYTSGTTGAPKGVMQLHGAVVKKGVDRAARYGFGTGDRLLLSVSLYTQWGCNALLVSHLAQGVTVVLQEEFDAREALLLMAGERCTIFSGTPTHFRMLLEAMAETKVEAPSLKYANISGDLIADDFYRLVQSKFRSARIISGYGMTETTGLVTITQPMDRDEPSYQTIGEPMCDIELKAVNVDSGESVADGEVGELCTRGYHLMRGYYKDDAATEKVVDAQGWLHTGDVGKRLPDGRWAFCGRIKDMVRSGGFNVFASDIEEFILRYPNVREVAVIGLPDPKYGEIVAAVVRADRPELVEPAALLAFCRESMANFKLPRRIAVTSDAFPISATGKVQKQKLKSFFVDQRGGTA